MHNSSKLLGSVHHELDVIGCSSSSLESVKAKINKTSLSFKI